MGKSAANAGPTSATAKTAPSRLVRAVGFLTAAGIRVRILGRSPGKGRTFRWASRERGSLEYGAGDRQETAATDVAIFADFRAVALRMGQLSSAELRGRPKLRKRDYRLISEPAGSRKLTPLLGRPIWSALGT